MPPGGRGDTSRWYDAQVAVDQLRRDISVKIEKLADDHHELVERLALMEGSTDTIDMRLKAGAETFQEVRTAIKNLSDVVADEVRPKKMTRGKIVGFILSLFSVLALLGGILWKAAQYPTREEFKETTRDTNAKIESVSNDVNSLKYEQAEIKALSRRANNSTANVETKVDTLVRRKKAAEK